MKFITLITTASLVLSLTTSISAQKTADRFIDQVKKERESVVMTLPGWLVRTGINIAIEEDLDEGRGIQDIVDGIKKIRFAIIDSEHNIESADIQKLVALSQEDDQMKIYVKAREDGQQMHVLVKEVKDRIRAVVIVSYSEDEFAILNIKTNISLTDLENARFSFNKERAASNYNYSKKSMK